VLWELDTYSAVVGPRSGFETGITATIGGQSATVNLTDENTLTITVPTLSSGLKDLALTNPDGSTYLLQSAISVP
jgi:hypothetical protein